MARAPAAALVAAATLAALPPGCGGDDDSGPALPKRVPAVRDAEPRELSGDPDADVTLPPRDRLFGFSGILFAWTGRFPDLDQGVTPEVTVNDAVAAGANSARIHVPWWDLEPEPGQPNRPLAAVYDRFVHELERRGGRALLFLGTPPPWASTRPGDPGAAPRTDKRSLRAFARFAASVATRWPQAAAIETWNEPNGDFAWEPSPDPKAYLHVHRAAARAIRRANPRVKVLLGGLAAVPEDTDQFMRAQTYLKRLYAAGLRPRDYDGLALHPYPGPDGVGGEDFARALEDFRLGHAWIDPRAELWITETGAYTTGPDGVEPEAQAETVVALTRLFLTMPRVAGVYLHTQYELTSHPASSPERGYGVLESRRAAPGRPKPAFCALRALVARPPPFAGCPP